MKLFIKNMVSSRSKTIVTYELHSIGIKPVNAAPGKVEVKKNLTHQQRHNLNIGLSRHGMELLDDTSAMLVEKIQHVIIEMIHHIEERPAINFSVYLTNKLNYDYTYLANLFSSVYNTTIEQCIISHKIEKVKMLLVEHELTLTAIAARLHYSSVSHLANQFKKVTGCTTSHFKTQKSKGRLSLEKVCGES